MRLKIATYILAPVSVVFGIADIVRALQHHTLTTGLMGVSGVGLGVLAIAVARRIPRHG